MKTETESPIAVAVRLVGSQRKLAEALDVHPSMISQMVKDRRKVPATMCRRISAVTGGQVRPEELRPDVFGAPEDCAA